MAARRFFRQILENQEDRKKYEEHFSQTSVGKHKMRVLDGEFMLSNRTAATKLKRPEGEEQGDKERNDHALKRRRRLQGSGLFGYKPRKEIGASASATGSKEREPIINNGTREGKKTHSRRYNEEEDHDENEETELGKDDLSDIDTNSTGLFRYKPKAKKAKAASKKKNDLKSSSRLNSTVSTSKLKKGAAGNATKRTRRRGFGTPYVPPGRRLKE